MQSRIASAQQEFDKQIREIQILLTNLDSQPHFLDQVKVRTTVFNKVKDWENATRVARYSVSALASSLQISEMHLRRHFANFGLPLHETFHALKMRDVRRLLRARIKAGAVSEIVGYHQVYNLRRDFLKFFSKTISEYLRTTPIQPGDNDFAVDYFSAYVKKSSQKLPNVGF